MLIIKNYEVMEVKPIGDYVRIHFVGGMIISGIRLDDLKKEISPKDLVRIEVIKLRGANQVLRVELWDGKGWERIWRSTQAAILV